MKNPAVEIEARSLESRNSERLCRVSRGHLLSLDPSLDRRIELVKPSAQVGVVPSFFGGDQGEAGTQDPVIDARAEQRGATTLSGHPIAMGPGDSLDQAVQPQPAQVVAHLPHSHVVGRLAQERGPMAPEIAAGETTGEQSEHQHRAEKGLHGRVREAQTAGSLSADLDRLIDTAERVFAHGTVLADPLDVQETSIGLEADQGLRISLGRLAAVGSNSPLLLCSPAGWELDASCTIDRQDHHTASGTPAPCPSTP